MIVYFSGVWCFTNPHCEKCHIVSIPWSETSSKQRRLGNSIAYINLDIEELDEILHRFCKTALRMDLLRQDITCGSGSLVWAEK